MGTRMSVCVGVVPWFPLPPRLEGLEDSPSLSFEILGALRAFEVIFFSLKSVRRGRNNKHIRTIDMIQCKISI